MIENLRMKVELREEVAQTSVAVIEESEIEQAIDSYMMKEENKKKMVTAGLLPQIGAYWDNGLRFKSRDGNFKLKVVGRIMNDWGWFDEDNGIKRTIGDQVDGTEFRSARFYMKGSIYKNIGYKLQLDYAGGNINFNDVFMELMEIPILGNFRVGHTKEPFSRITPKNNFKWGRGKRKGALELAARYSELDLSNHGINGGRLQDTTLGINWYLNPNTRVTLNYVHANVDRLIGATRLNDDSADLVAMRFYIDF